MEALISALQVGFLLRSLIAGAYFVAAYAFAKGGIAELSALPTAGARLAFLVILVGITAYTLHRALVYPFIESFFNSRTAQSLRRSGRVRFVSPETVKVLKDLWCAAEQSSPDKAAISHIRTWADYTHVLYVSSFSLVGGISLAEFTAQSAYDPRIVIALSYVMLVGALLSDWRLHAVRELMGFGCKPNNSLERNRER